MVKFKFSLIINRLLFIRLMRTGSGNIRDNSPLSSNTSNHPANTKLDATMSSTTSSTISSSAFKRGTHFRSTAGARLQYDANTSYGSNGSNNGKLNINGANTLQKYAKIFLKKCL